MALKGNLRDFTILQLLNLISLARKTGGLHIDGNLQHVVLYFQGGQLVCGYSGNERIPLIRMLGKAKLIPAAQAAVMAERFKGSSEMETGILLMNAGYLSRDRILSGVVHYLSGLIRELFTIHEGEFNFVIGETLPEECIPARVDLTELIMEGSRQLQEMDELMREIPNLDLSIRLIESPGRDIRRLNLNTEEWRVVSYANPKNNLRQIASAAQLNDFQVRRSVYALLQAGLVELIKPMTTGNLVNRRYFPVGDVMEQKSLVNRVIDRIKAI